MEPRKVAGALLFLAALQFWILETVAETFFPGYSTRLNTLSDLASAATIVPPRASIVEPSFTIFNSTVFLFGLMSLVAAFFIYRAFQNRALTLLVGVLGLGAMGVGIFPGDTGMIHVLVSLVTFISGSLAAIAAYKVEKPPLKYISVAMGVFALSSVVSLVLVLAFSPSPLSAVLGRGGEERMVAYPVLAWLLAFGGHLMGLPKD